MEQYIYEKIRDDFIHLRYLTSGMEDNRDAVREITEDLKRILPYIHKFGTEDEREVLGYAVGTAAELADRILMEKRTLFFGKRYADKLRMVNAFCDAVHNICELFTLDTWDKEEYYTIFIAPFQRKYGGKYFEEVLYFFGME